MTKHCIGCRLQINETAQTCPVCGNVQDTGKTGLGPVKSTNPKTGNTQPPEQIKRGLAAWTLAVISGWPKHHTGRQARPAANLTHAENRGKLSR